MGLPIQEALVIGRQQAGYFRVMHTKGASRTGSR